MGHRTPDVKDALQYILYCSAQGSTNCQRGRRYVGAGRASAAYWSDGRRRVCSLVNKKQKATLVVGTALFLLAGLFPPLQSGWSFCGGPWLIFNLGGLRAQGCSVDLLRLLILWVLVAVCTAVVLAVLRDRKTPTDQPHEESADEHH